MWFKIDIPVLAGFIFLAAGSSIKLWMLWWPIGGGGGGGKIPPTECFKKEENLSINFVHATFGYQVYYYIYTSSCRYIACPSAFLMYNGQPGSDHYPIHLTLFMYTVLNHLYK